jgi:hypothetical protein
MRSLLAAAVAARAVAAAAQPHSAGECREGGDFIRNAALARDAGASREFFVGRLPASACGIVETLSRPAASRARRSSHVRGAK